MIGMTSSPPNSPEPSSANVSSSASGPTASGPSASGPSASGPTEGQIRDDKSAPPPLTTWQRVVKLTKLTIKIAVVVVLVILAVVGSHWTMRLLDTYQDVPHIKWGLIFLLLLSYALLLSVPFVPGLEIGIFVMMLDGGKLAPLAYLAALAGLCLSFFIGRRLGRPVRDEALLRRILGLFKRLRLTKAGDLLVHVIPLSPSERVKFLYEHLPGWLAPLAVKLRYGLLAVLLNVPGNSVLGGGGGLSLMAGLSGTFGPVAGVLSLAVGLAPIPIGMYFWAETIQGWFV